MSHDVIVVRGDLGDPEALYVDGKFVFSDGVITPDDVLEHFDIHVKFVECDFEWIEEHKAFPENLCDVKLEEE
jgi:hypothetical protein